MYQKCSACLLGTVPRVSGHMQDGYLRRTPQQADNQLWKCLHPAGVRPQCSSTPSVPHSSPHFTEPAEQTPSLSPSSLPPGRYPLLPTLASVQGWNSTSPSCPHPLIPFLVPFFSGLPSVSCVALSYLTSASPIGVPKSFSPSILS